MLIKPHTLNHWINHFYGYGSWNAPVWFVAHEEGGGDLPEEVAEKLDYFHDKYTEAISPNLLDIRTVYRNVGIRWEGSKAELFRNRYEYRFGDKAVLNKVWENLIRFTYGYKNQELPDMLDYQRHQFAGPLSNETLIRLYPLPGANHHGWNYNWLDLPDEFGYLKSRALYQDRIYQHRIHDILGAMANHRPEVVLMYGMSNINQLKYSVSEFFPDAKFSLVKSVKLKTPQHHRVNINGTIVLITTQIPALRHNRIETGFDWLAFGEMVRSPQVR